MMAHTVFNYVEACFWAALRAFCFFSTLKSSRKPKQTAYAMAALLLLFGLSDIVEASTGAWWRPWWLLLWKAACIAALLVCILFFCRNRR